MATTVQPDNTPTAKVTAMSLAGAAVTVGISVAEHFGLDVPPDVAGALVIILAFLAGYGKKSRPGEIDL